MKILHRKQVILAIMNPCLRRGFGLRQAGTFLYSLPDMMDSYGYHNYYSEFGNDHNDNTVLYVRPELRFCIHSTTSMSTSGVLITLPVILLLVKNVV